MRMGKSVLIIDDQDSLVIGRFLRDLGIEYFTADSIESAFQAMKENTPSLIFLDLLLGFNAEDGLTFLKKRTAIPWLKKIPVLVLSGKGDRDTISESLRFKADGYVIKPFSQRILKEKLIEFKIMGGTE
jgi:DNA-binding response OmpR family regulator